MRVRSLTRPAVGLLATFAVVATLVSGAGASSATKRVSGAPRWATRSNFVRRARPGTEIDIAVVLGWRDPAGVASFAAAVSDPRSASYGKYLSPAQFRARFSQSDAAVASVSSWLRNTGLQVGTVPANHLFVGARGTVAQVEKAFGIQLNMYRTAGRVMRAPDADPQVPASIAGVVQGVIGLASTRVQHSGPSAPPAPVFVQGKPCSEFWGQKTAKSLPKAYGHKQPYTPCGYAPKQVRGAYGLGPVIKSGTDGSGVTVAVIDAFNSPTIRKDLTIYSQRHGLPKPKLKQYNVKPLPGDIENKQGWYGEETLDLDAIHGMAPGAKLVYAGAKDNSDLNILERVVYVIDNHLASIVNNSYGNAGEALPAAEIRAEEAAYQQAIAEGIGFYFSSGDCGDNLDPQGLCGGTGARETDYPASSPNVTAVGGTSLAVSKSNGYLFETGWGTGFSPLGPSGQHWNPKPPGYYLYGGGGGTSKRFAEPAYQQGVVPTSLSGYWGKSNRVVPDFAADGDPNTGYLVGQTQTFPNGKVRYSEYRLGGTSLSSPLVAGIMALANQYAGHDLGFVNPLLYSLDASAFRDIVDPSSTVAVARTNYANGVNAAGGLTYSLRTMNQTGTLHTIPGYDDVTGRGTPNGWDFLQALAAGGGPA